MQSWLPPFLLPSQAGVGVPTPRGHPLVSAPTPQSEVTAVKVQLGHCRGKMFILTFGDCFSQKEATPGKKCSSFIKFLLSLCRTWFFFFFFSSFFLAKSRWFLADTAKSPLSSHKHGTVWGAPWGPVMSFGATPSFLSHNDCIFWVWLSWGIILMGTENFKMKWVRLEKLEAIEARLLLGKFLAALPWA